MLLPPLRSIPITAALLGGLLLFSAACGGTSETSTMSSPPESQSVLAEGQGDASLGGPTPAPTALPLQRYRYDATLTLTEERRAGDMVSIGTSGRFVYPDRHSLTYTLELADGTQLQRRLVAIGPSVWVQVTGTGWRRTDMQDRQVVELLGTAFSPLRSEFLGGEGLGRVQESVQDLHAAPETINGIPSLHYKVDTAGKDRLDAFLPPGGPSAARGVAWDLWLARDGGWPVRVQATFSIPQKTELLSGLGLQAPARWKLVIEVSTPNDPGLMIYPPSVRN